MSGSGTTTVNSGNGGSSTTTWHSKGGLSVAQQIANALAAAGTLSVTSSSGGTIPTPTTVSGTTQDLVLTGTPTNSVPAGYNFVTNDVSGPTTITAGAGTAIT